ncbi:hypothetical protein [Zoogloea sp.]|uniref:hypothetical protein n=1 Tax=Zoogloea sp. TaxID=49181 RepID=UPI001415C2B4|nr:MAG: hypothetical protein F9K15_18440 [Zoogloea sp.]
MKTDLMTIAGEVDVVGLSRSADVEPLIGKPSLILKRPDGSTVALLGLTEEECRAGARAFMDPAVISLSAGGEA